MADERLAGLGALLGEDGGGHVVHDEGAEQQEGEGEDHILFDEILQDAAVDGRGKESQLGRARDGVAVRQHIIVAVDVVVAQVAVQRLLSGHLALAARVAGLQLCVVDHTTILVHGHQAAVRARVGGHRPALIAVHSTAGGGARRHLVPVVHLRAILADVGGGAEETAAAALLVRPLVLLLLVVVRLVVLGESGRHLLALVLSVVAAVVAVHVRRKGAEERRGALAVVDAAERAGVVQDHVGELRLGRVHGQDGGGGGRIQLERGEAGAVVLLTRGGGSNRSQSAANNTPCANKADKTRNVSGCSVCCCSSSNCLKCRASCGAVHTIHQRHNVACAARHKANDRRRKRVGIKHGSNDVQRLNDWLQRLAGNLGQQAVHGVHGVEVLLILRREVLKSRVLAVAVHVVHQASGHGKVGGVLQLANSAVQSAGKLGGRLGVSRVDFLQRARQRAKHKLLEGSNILLSIGHLRERRRRGGCSSCGAIKDLGGILEHSLALSGQISSINDGRPRNLIRRLRQSCRASAVHLGGHTNCSRCKPDWRARAKDAVLKECVNSSGVVNPRGGCRRVHHARAREQRLEAREDDVHLVKEILGNHLAGVGSSSRKLGQAAIREVPLGQRQCTRPVWQVTSAIGVGKRRSPQLSSCKRRVCSALAQVNALVELVQVKRSLEQVRLEALAEEAKALGGERLRRHVAEERARRVAALGLVDEHVVLVVRVGGPVVRGPVQQAALVEAAAVRQRHAQADLDEAVLGLVVDDDVAHRAAVLAGGQHAGHGVEHGVVLAHGDLAGQRVHRLVHAGHLKGLGLEHLAVVHLVKVVAILAIERGLVRLARTRAQQKVLVVLRAAGGQVDLHAAVCVRNALNKAHKASAHPSGRIHRSGWTPAERYRWCQRGFTRRLGEATHHKALGAAVELQRERELVTARFLALICPLNIPRGPAQVGWTVIQAVSVLVVNCVFRRRAVAMKSNANQYVCFLVLCCAIGILDG